MAKAQHENLMIEWSLYSPEQQKAIFQEFKANGGDVYSEEGFQNFLIERLEIEGYWRKIGLI